MQTQRSSTPRARQQRRTLRDFAPGTLTTAISIGAVVLLVALTFVGDWLQVPELALSAPGQFISPNGDGSYDIFTINYRLGDDAKVTARVYSDQNLVRTLAEAQPQSRGDHFLTWDGRNDLGAAVADGTYRIEILASGALRSVSQSVTAQVDTLPPTVQLVNLPDAMRVNKPDLLIEGITEAGAVVWLSSTAQPLRVDNAGRFAFQAKLLDGDNRFQIQAIDPAGNTTLVQRNVSLVTQAPEIVITRPLDNEWTNQQLLTIEGRTLPNTVLTINQQQVKVGPDGFFQHQVLLNEGDNALRLVATDDVGNVTTLDRLVHLKTGAPPIQVNIQDGAQVADANLQLIGKVDPGSAVQINGREIPVSALGDFQVTIPLLNGDNTLDIQSTDQAGNITRLVRRVTYATGGADPLARVSENFNQFPLLVIPSALVLAIILAFIYLRQNRVSLALSVEQNTFVPGYPGDDKSLAILLDLSKNARVSLEVLDQQGYPRATILHNRRKVGRRHVFYWNGYDDRARPLPPGEYTIQAEAGAPPLQVTSAVQVRIERQAMPHVQTPAYVRGQSVTGTRQEK